MKKMLFIKYVAVGVLFISMTVIVDAAQNGQSGGTGQSGGPDKDMKSLKKGGYHCEALGVEAYVCTRPGSPTYYCNPKGTVCVSTKKRRQTPLRPKLNAPKQEVSPN